MRILLISMPDAIPLFYAYQSRVPHLGLASISANTALPGCEIKTLNLIFHSRQVLNAVKEAITSFKPNLVGLSAMSFQYKSAQIIARFIRGLDGNIKIALGGYHATLMYDEITEDEKILLPFDFIIRGEGEITFKKLVIEIISGSERFNNIEGLSFRNGETFVHNIPRNLTGLEEIKLPIRDNALFKMHHGPFGRAEAVETSRGCTMDCNFCSINKMYGRHYRAYPIERVIEDIKIAKQAGAIRIMLSDDNVTLKTERLERLCERIIEERLNDIWYGTEASCRGIASSEKLVKKMREANFGMVFLGIENISKKSLLELGKGDIRKETLRAIHYLKKYDIGVMGGFILGNPSDDKDDIRKIFNFSKRVSIDFLMSQILTPYPKTDIREKLISMGMVENKDDYTSYNGYGCNIRTESISNKELRRLVVLENIKWFSRELLNRHNWFAASKRVKRRTYIMVLAMTVRLIFRFISGGFAKSTHKIMESKAVNKIRLRK